MQQEVNIRLKLLILKCAPTQALMWQLLARWSLQLGSLDAMETGERGSFEAGRLESWQGHGHMRSRKHDHMQTPGTLQTPSTFEDSDMDIQIQV